MSTETTTEGDRTSGRYGHLARGKVSFFGSIAQSVGLIGPSAGAGLITIPIFGIVGPIGWSTWLIGTVALLCVAYGISVLARRFLTTGGLYPLAGKAAGRAAGFFTMFGALLWLIVAAPAVALGSGIYITDFLNLPAFGVAQTTTLVVVFSVAVAIIAAWIAYAGIKISVEVLLILEAVTMSLIILLLIITLFQHHGGVIDHRQFHFGGTSISTILSGVVLVVYAFGGFESATVLGQEAKDGRRTIPYAVGGSILVAGLFLAFLQYVTVLGFSGTSYHLSASPNALGDLAKISGISWYEYIINGALIVAVLANNIALYNAGARMLFTLPREGAPGRWLLRTSQKYLTPIAGVVVFLLVDVITLAVLGFANANTVIAWGNLGTLSGYGAIVMYVVTLIAVLVFMARSRTANLGGAAICVLGGAIMGYALYKSFNPFPSYPTDVYTWVFVGAAAIAILTYVVIRVRPGRLFEGASVDEDTTAAERIVGEVSGVT
jgi:amino acid transporter